MSIHYIIGHRGALEYAPENTMLSFEKAVELGANAIEGDFRMTRDGACVCIHDETVDRTTNGKGRVEEMTLSEIRKLDAGAGQKVPTLAEFVQFAIQKKVLGFVEINSPGMEPAVLDVIQEQKATKENIVIISFFPETLKNVIKLNNKLPLGLIFSIAAENIISVAAEIPCSSILPEKSLVTKELVETAHTNRLAVIPWNANTAEEAKKLENLDVDSLATDQPKIVKAAVKFQPPQLAAAQAPVPKVVETPPPIILLK